MIAKIEAMARVSLRHRLGENKSRLIGWGQNHAQTKFVREGGLTNMRQAGRSRCDGKKMEKDWVIYFSQNQVPGTRSVRFE